MAALLGATSGSSAPPAAAAPRVIVQATDAASAKRLVDSVGGTGTPDASVGRAVGVLPSAAQRDRRAGLQGVLRLDDQGGSRPEKPAETDHETGGEAPHNTPIPQTRGGQT